MFGFFDYEKLGKRLPVWGEAYPKAEPFPHIQIDQFANERHLYEVLGYFPKPEELKWWSYDNTFEKKLAYDRIHELASPIRKVLAEMNSAPFIEFLEKLTGIEGLIPDPHYMGGGLHQIQSGGKLDVHVDFNWHKRLKLDRRLNVILYLNDCWKEEWGGHLELWNAEMTECKKKIAPLFNRMVCFSTTESSYHGHPEPLKCPMNRTRKSLALYYYTNGRPEHEKVNPHSTKYQRRPQDPVDSETERLRDLRGKGVRI